mmetsp:Transcript_17146/g.34888  ORF Transcript_17146/g.34888 Transcript_17146/m.34888 type:complete len:262 (-) Transcript_17146:276-1061(-)
MTPHHGNFPSGNTRHGHGDRFGGQTHLHHGASPSTRPEGIEAGLFESPRVDCEIDSHAFRELHDLLVDIIFCDVVVVPQGNGLEQRRLDGVRGPEFVSLFQCRRRNIHGDDVRGSKCRCDCHAGESQTAAAEHRHRFLNGSVVITEVFFSVFEKMRSPLLLFPTPIPFLYVQQPTLLQHRPKRRPKPTPQRGSLHETHPLRYLPQISLGPRHGAIFGKGPPPREPRLMLPFANRRSVPRGEAFAAGSAAEYEGDGDSVSDS